MLLPIIPIAKLLCAALDWLQHIRDGRQMARLRGDKNTEADYVHLSWFDPIKFQLWLTAAIPGRKSISSPLMEAFVVLRRIQCNVQFGYVA